MGHQQLISYKFLCFLTSQRLIVPLPHFVDTTCANVAQESGGSARTDYRAIQLAKKKKQRGSSASSSGETPLPPPLPIIQHYLTVTLLPLESGSSGSSQRKCKTARASAVLSAIRYSEGSVAANGGLTLRDPITGAQYVQIQLLQVGLAWWVLSLLT